MTEVQAAAAAYACSGATITLLWVLARRNRASGWYRQRHPNCFIPLEQSTVASRFSIPDPGPVTVGPQLLALHNAVARHGVTAPAKPVAQDQYVEASAAAVTSMK
jgi:hypothetical protein